MLTLSKPTDTEDSKKRVHEEPKLSDVEHDVEGDHNSDYDHEAFLGKEDAKTFDQLSPEDARNRLRFDVEVVVDINRCHVGFPVGASIHNQCYYPM